MSVWFGGREESIQSQSISRHVSHAAAPAFNTSHLWGCAHSLRAGGVAGCGATSARVGIVVGCPGYRGGLLPVSLPLIAVSITFYEVLGSSANDLRVISKGEWGREKGYFFSLAFCAGVCDNEKVGGFICSIGAMH